MPFSSSGISVSSLTSPLRVAPFLPGSPSCTSSMPLESTSLPAAPSSKSLRRRSTKPLRLNGELPVPSWRSSTWANRSMLEMSSSIRLKLAKPSALKLRPGRLTLISSASREPNVRVVSPFGPARVSRTRLNPPFTLTPLPRLSVTDSAARSKPNSSPFSISSERETSLIC